MVSEPMSVFLRTPLADQVQYIMDLVVLGRKVRPVKMRQPLAEACVYCWNPYVVKHWAKDVREELNVKSLTVVDWRDLCNKPRFSTPSEVVFDTNLTPELIAEGEQRQQEREKRRGRSLLETLDNSPDKR